LQRDADPLADVSILSPILTEIWYYGIQTKDVFVPPEPRSQDHTDGICSQDFIHSLFQIEVSRVCQKICDALMTKHTTTYNRLVTVAVAFGSLVRDSVNVDCDTQED
jgi:hypothetical protein